MEDSIVKLNDEEIKLTVIYDHKDYDKFRPQTTALITIIDFGTYTDEDHELVDYILLLNSSRKGFVIYQPVNEDIEYVAEKLKMSKLYTLDQHGLDVFNEQFDFTLQIPNFFDEWDIVDPVEYYNLIVPEAQINPDMTEDEEFIAWLPEIVSEAYCVARYFIEKRLIVPTQAPVKFEHRQGHTQDQASRRRNEKDEQRAHNKHQMRDKRAAQHEEYEQDRRYRNGQDEERRWRDKDGKRARSDSESIDSAAKPNKNQRQQRQTPTARNNSVVEASAQKQPHYAKYAHEAAQRFSKRFAVFVQGKVTQKANAYGYDNVHPVLLGQEAFTVVLSDQKFEESKLKAEFGSYYIVSSE